MKNQNADFIVMFWYFKSCISGNPKYIRAQCKHTLSPGAFQLNRMSLELFHGPLQRSMPTLPAASSIEAIILFTRRQTGLFLGEGHSRNTASLE